MPNMIGVIAIGRNEGERLRVCLASALRDSRHVVYVDSGSTDGSVKLAREMGAHVVELDLSIPFTAARARNEGFEKLMSIAPEVEFVQFLDGDCEIIEGWVKRAITYMNLAQTPVSERAREEPDSPSAHRRSGSSGVIVRGDRAIPDLGVCATESRIAIVCGRRRERFPRASIYNALCDMEWNTPIGKARACGGDALIRASAFREVSGYNPAIIAGEEPEMCVRLRAKGWEIHRIDADMTLHDAAMTHLSQWWKRSLRSGHAFAEGYALHGAPPERHNERQVRSIWIWGLALPAACAIATISTALLAPRWWWIPLLLLLLYPLLILKVARSKRSLAYGFFIVLGKFPQLLGMLRYKYSRARGRRSTLIEYKGAIPAPTKT
jgi:glycosyltransferase involved in cell wall biosynthesis